MSHVLLCEALLGVGLSPCEEVIVELLEEKKLVLLRVGNGVVIESESDVVMSVEEDVDVPRVATVGVGIDVPGTTSPGASTLLVEVGIAGEDAGGAIT